MAARPRDSKEGTVMTEQERKELRSKIRAELKRCADELASTDVSMQTLRDMILNESGE